MKTKIAIFDDHDNRRDGLELLINLSEGKECVGKFRDCSNVLADIEHCNPDIVLMDIDMPEVNGIEGVKLIRSKFPSIKILMQTVFEEDEKIFESIRAGADGYILKKVQPNDLLRAIDEVMDGGAPMTPSIAKQVLQFVNLSQPKPTKIDFQLTNREKEILSLLVEGLSYKMISQRCDIAIKTVNSHIQHIYEKLHVSSGTEAVAKAISNQIV